VKRVVEVPVHEESVAVTYDRDAYLRASAGAAPSFILDRQPGFARSHASIEVLADTIVSWDLVDDDGRACAFDRDFLNELPLHFLYGIAQAIEADVFASESD